MILFVSDGRLGNQLFQYAFLKSVAKQDERILGYRMEKIKDLFKINESRFIMPGLSDRGFRLFQRFIRPLLELFAGIKLIGLIQESRSEGRPNGKVKISKGLLPFTFVKTAFFQSEAFFEANKLELEFKRELNYEAQEYLSRIPEEYEKVFVHVRRGDYLNEVFAGEKGIELPLEYYENAIGLIKEKLENPYFIFLSDDPEFCESKFEKVEHKLISRNNLGVDLAIMSQCEHAIIANSSFSWWGAYFMPKKKTVYYPKYWYGWRAKVHSHPAIYPTYGNPINV